MWCSPSLEILHFLLPSIYKSGILIQFQNLRWFQAIEGLIRAFPTSVLPSFFGCNLKWEEFTSSNTPPDIPWQVPDSNTYSSNFERLSKSPTSFSAISLMMGEKQFQTQLNLLSFCHSSYPGPQLFTVLSALQCLWIDAFLIFCTIV